MSLPETEILRRKMQLKTQALKLIRAEKEELCHRLTLAKLKTYLETRITQDFNRELSAQLDAVQFLIESFENGGRSFDLSPEALTFGRPASSPTGGEDGTTAPTTFK
jgi:hypothetical protein